jgi:hypothetical protein
MEMNDFKTPPPDQPTQTNRRYQVKIIGHRQRVASQAQPFRPPQESASRVASELALMTPGTEVSYQPKYLALSATPALLRIDVKDPHRTASAPRQPPFIDVSAPPRREL